VSRDRSWERLAARVARGVDRRVENVRSNILGRPTARQVLAYRGFGNDTEAFVSGRVLANRPVGPVSETDHWLTNLGRSLRHLESDEVPGARIRIRIHSRERTAISDEGGYFRAWIPLDPDTSRTADWHEAEIDVVEPLHPAVARVHASGSVLVPPAAATAGVISDIDDTVIRTDATRLLRMLKRTLLENARTRLPFPGVAEFYSGLRAGASGADDNPTFYVSSSPWNLYPVLTDFLEHQNIPAGPLMLRDWAISERGILPTRHGEHKLGAIRQIMECYPALPFILIGDSGQEDPEIYRTIVHDYGDRILAVYIRNVTTGPDRVAAVEELAKEVGQAGSELLLSDDTAASAVHAAERGWLDSAALDAVIAAVNSS
jgi:phosphatidate phosphatase APP1